jgi:hypothetical protein
LQLYHCVRSPGHPIVRADIAAPPEYLRTPRLSRSPLATRRSPPSPYIRPPILASPRGPRVALRRDLIPE